MENKLLTISEAATYLGVSIDTIRRWDNNGKLIAIRKNGGTHRYYRKEDLLKFNSNLFQIAQSWVLSNSKIPSDFHCPYSPTFQSHLITMQDELMRIPELSQNFSLIVAVVGEIGNNSYDHNLGNWPDVPGVFFAYDIEKKVIILADRGLGILTTLKKVKPELMTHEAALKVAFTEIISGRAPEERGNGLKFVREVISQMPISLLFQTGDSELRMEGNNRELFITRSAYPIHGCIALIQY
ncbi:hypothetical protein BH09PAT2_BH09PAT2_09810 [soil metagenome]